MPTFGDIRSILHEAPGEASWARLVVAIDAYEDAAEFSTRALPYCVASLDAWPEAIPRFIPADWLRRAAHGDASLARLGNGIRGWCPERQEGVRALVSGGVAARILHVRPPRARGEVFERMWWTELLSACAQTRTFELIPTSSETVRDELRVIAGWEHLEELALTDFRDKLGACIHLASLDLPALRAFSVRGVTSALLEILGEGRWFAQLERASLVACGLDPDWIMTLCDGPLVENMRELDLSGNELDDVAFVSVMSSPRLARLRALGLARTMAPGAFGEHLLEDLEAGAFTLTALERLDFEGNALDEEAARHLRAFARDRGFVAHV